MNNPGELDSKITVQVKTVTRDAFGGAVETWADEKAPWAKKIDQGSREFRAAGIQNAEVTTLWRMRYYEGLTPRHRIIHGGKTYEITGVTDGPKRANETIVQTKVNP